MASAIVWRVSGEGHVISGNSDLTRLCKCTSKNRSWFVTGIAKGSEDIEGCCLYIKDMVVNCHIIHHSRSFGIRLCFHLQALSRRFFAKSSSYSLHQFFPIVWSSVAVIGLKKKFGNSQTSEDNMQNCIKYTRNAFWQLLVKYFYFRLRRNCVCWSCALCTLWCSHCLSPG